MKKLKNKDKFEMVCNYNHDSNPFSMKHKINADIV